MCIKFKPARRHSNTHETMYTKEEEKHWWWTTQKHTVMLSLKKRPIEPEMDHIFILYSIPSQFEKNRESQANERAWIISTWWMPFDSFSWCVCVCFIRILRLLNTMWKKTNMFSKHGFQSKNGTHTQCHLFHIYRMFVRTLSNFMIRWNI